MGTSASLCGVTCRWKRDPPGSQLLRTPGTQAPVDSALAAATLPHMVQPAVFQRFRVLAATLAPLALALGCAHSATGLPLDEKRQAVEGGQALEHIKVLSSPAFEGRGVDTDGINRAARYIADHFRRLGLQPGGDDGTYFQKFERVVKRSPGQHTLLSALGKTLTVGDDLAILPWSGSGSASAEVVFVGYGITDTKNAWDDYAGLEVKGRIVVVLRYAPGVTTAGGDPAIKLEARALDLSSKVRNAGQHGAVGLLLVNPPGGDDDFVSPRIEEGSLPALQVRRTFAAELLRAGGVDLEALAGQITLTKRPTGRALAQPVRASMQCDQQVDKRMLQNVVARLPGTDPLLKEQYVVIGGHYDHHGFAQSGFGAMGKRGELHPGADDNASGTSAVLELAEAFALREQAPRRTVIFMAFTGEERGLWGSAHYVAHPIYPLDRTVLMLNLDMVGRLKGSHSEVDGTKKSVLDVGGVGTSPGLRALVEHANSEQIPIVWDPSGEAPSDNTSFFEKNVPVLFFFSGMHADYHRPSDTWDKIDVDGLGKNARLAWRVATAITDTDLPVPFTRPKEKPVFGKHRNQGGSDKPMPRLGLMPEYGDRTDGMSVTAVITGGAAEKAGMQSGDLVVELGGQPVRSVQDYMEALSKFKGGEEIEVVVIRKGQRTALKAKLAPPRRRS